jgi:hypothetical protein
VVGWRDQAEHAAASLSKGSRVVVVGRLQQRSWTAEDGTARQTVEVVADELGPSLRWATATTTRVASQSERYRLRDRHLSCLAVSPEPYWAVAAQSAHERGGPMDPIVVVAIILGIIVVLFLLDWRLNRGRTRPWQKALPTETQADHEQRPHQSGNIGPFLGGGPGGGGGGSG